MAAPPDSAALFVFPQPLAVPKAPGARTETGLYPWNIRKGAKEFVRSKKKRNPSWRAALGMALLKYERVH